MDVVPAWTLLIALVIGVALGFPIGRLGSRPSAGSAEPRDVPAAEVAFRVALELARRQSARSYELRAAMSWARLLRDQGKRDAARELLAPVHGWFTEGHDTHDLRAAAALLAELR